MLWFTVTNNRLTRRALIRAHTSNVAQKIILKLHLGKIETPDHTLCGSIINSEYTTFAVAYHPLDGIVNLLSEF